MLFPFMIDGVRVGDFDVSDLVQAPLDVLGRELPLDHLTQAAVIGQAAAGYQGQLWHTIVPTRGG